MDANLEVGNRRSEDRGPQEFSAQVGRAISRLSAAPGNARLAQECEPYQKTCATEVDSGEQPAKTRILVLDEQPLLRYGISVYLNSQPDMMVCGDTGSISDGGEQAGDAREFQIRGSKTYPKFFRNFGSQISHMNMEGQPPTPLLDGG